MLLWDTVYKFSVEVALVIIILQGSVPSLEVKSLSGECEHILSFMICTNTKARAVHKLPYYMPQLLRNILNWKTIVLF